MFKKNKKILIAIAVVLVVIIVVVISVVVLKKKSDVSENDGTEPAVILNEGVETSEAIIDAEEPEVIEAVKLLLDTEQMAKNDALFADYSEKEKTPIWTFPEISAVGEWSANTPGISPYGEEANYSDGEYESYKNDTFSYIDDNQTLKETDIYGERFEMTYSSDESMSVEDVAQFPYDYKRFIEKNGGVCLGTYRDVWTYYFENDGKWWVEISMYYNDVNIVIMKENSFEINETLVIHPADYEENKRVYSVMIPDDKFITLIGEIDKGDVSINTKMETNYGDYERNTDIDTYLYEDEGYYFVDDDYIYESGRAYLTFNWAGNNPPETISLTLEAKYDVEPIDYGEQLGGIELSSDLVDKVMIEPTLGDDLRISHPEYDSDSLYFDQTQEETFVTFVPAGYYEIKVTTKEGLVNEFKTLKVPVHSGKVTTVTIPQGVTDAFKTERATDETGIFISDIVENDDEVSFIFSLIDATTKSVLPDKLNSEIFEGGMPVDILNIEPIPIPASVVLLLDSSGSMNGQMDQTIEAAKIFIEGLPAETDIRVIDFDTTPKPIELDEGESLIDALDGVKAKGATALYDSVLMGLEFLKSEKRPILVVFTDGEDANLNDTAQGSVASIEATLEAIDAASIPIYSIGFGEGHDSSTLETFADESLGKYYPAEDQTALEQVFASINDKITNTYMATYRRPTIASVSDIPVVEFVIDVSGSMYSDFYDTSGFRLDDVKRVYHDFIEGLPENTQIMVTTFNDQINMQQGITTSKVLALNAVGNLEAGGGTNILGSVNYGYESLRKVSSSKKVMVYITDAALEVEEDQEEIFAILLEKIAEDNIQVLWVGMGIEDETPFIEVAEKTHSDYVVTEDSVLLTEKFNVMLENVKAAPLSDETTVTLNIKKKTEEGAYEFFSKSVMYELSPVEKSDEVILMEAISYDSTDIVKQYDRITSQYISGDSIPAEETIITKRLKTDVSAQNDAAEFKINEIIFMSQLQGVEAPSGLRYMGVLMDMKHILPEQEVMVYPDGNGHPSSFVASSDQGEIRVAEIPYTIPNFTSHFGMSFNDLGPYPAATATWLTYEPLAVPGVYDITLNPDETKTGMMVYLVPDEALSQLGIHYYDDSYGYMNIPVVGVLPTIETTYDSHTKTAAKLMDNFTLEVNGYTTSELTEEAIVDSQHRVLDGNFLSDVKANINVEPNKGLYMRFPTDNGAFYTPLSKQTADIPLGFYSPITLTPGSNNPIKMAFQMPEVFENNTAELFLDLKDEDLSLEINGGESLAGSSIGSFENEYFKGDVNDVFYYDGKIDDRSRDFIIADITIHDIKDAYASRGVANNFYIDYDNEDRIIMEETPTSTTGGGGGLGSFAASSTYGYDDSLRFLYRLEHAVGVSSYTDELLLGIDGETIVYDGTSRRGYVIFEVPGHEKGQPFKLYFDDSDLEVEIGQKDAALTQPMLILKEEYEIDNNYDEDFEAALQRAIASYRLRHPGVSRTPVAGETLTEEVTMPSINSYGFQVVEQIQTIDDLTDTIKSLRYVSSGSRSDFSYKFSKEAVLTQGFGQEGDFANLAIEVLSRLGYKTKRRYVFVTETGEEILEKMAGIDNINAYTLPAISYQLENGEQRLMVLPFGRDISELSGLVYYEDTVGDLSVSHGDALEVYFDVIPTEKGQLAQMNNMSGALSGGSSEVSESREVLHNFRIPLATYSEDVIDLGMSVVGRKVYAVVYTADGPMMSDDYIDLAYYKITGMGFRLDEKTHHVNIDEDMEVNQVFISIGYNLPEMPEAAANMISNQMLESQDKNADTLDALKWLHRKAIYQFIGNQTAFERKLDKDYELATGRIETPRLIVVKSVMKDELITTMDLLTIQNDIHNGSEEAHESYRLMSGLAASSNEALALDNGLGYEAFWAAMPEDAALVMVDTAQLDLYYEDMVASGMTEEMLAYFAEINKMVIIPTAASIIDGEPRWAWLEITKHSYETISVLDTFEHGSMASNATLNSALEKAQYIIGAFKGVETSVWSVSAFSLELTEYKDIMTAAKAFALGIGKNFETEIGPLKFEIGKAPATTGVVKDIQDFFKKGEEKEDSKGFKEGYVDGVNFYFKVSE